MNHNLVVVATTGEPELRPAEPARPVRRDMDVAFTGLCAVVAVGRFVILRRTGAPPGIDAGNWLAMGHALFGDSVRSSSIVYPPVVPVLTAGAVGLLGPLNGISAMGAVSSLVPAVGTYIVLRDRASGWLGAVLSGLVAVAGATGEAAAWGGYPQLMGLGLAVLFLGLLDGALSTGDVRRCLVAGVVLALTLATSHFVSVLAVAAAVVLLVLRRRPARTTARAVLLVGLPCLPLVPLYLTLAQAFGASLPTSTLDHGNLVGNVEVVYRDFRWFWRPAFVVAVLTPLLLSGRRHRALSRVTTSLVVATAGLVVATREQRQLYLFSPAAVLALALWAGEIRGTAQKRAVTLLAVVALAAQSAVALPFFADQREYYAVLTPGTVAAIHWLGRETTDDAVVAVSPAADDWPLGWWVEGLAPRRTLPAAGLRWLNFPDERRRARLANRIFHEGFPGVAELRLAAEEGAAYVFVDKTWSGYTGARMVQLRIKEPDAFVLENESVVILRTGGGRAVAPLNRGPVPPVPWSRHRAAPPPAGGGAGPT